MNKLKPLYLQNPVFKFMISYTCILILPLLLCLIGYQVAFGIVEDEIKDNNLAVLNNSKGLVDHQIETLHMLVMQIAMDPKVNAVIEMESVEDKNFFIDASRAIDQVSAFLAASPSTLVESLYIYLGNTQYVLTPTSLYQETFFYKNILKTPAAVWDGWKQEVVGQEDYMNYFTKAGETNYVQSVPFKYNAVPTGGIVARLNIEKLMNLFSHYTEDNEATVFIENEEGALVWSGHEDAALLGEIDHKQLVGTQGVFSTKIRNEKTMVLYTVSKLNGWKYILMIPEKQVMDRLGNLQLTIWALLIICLIVGGIASYYMSQKYGRPIKEIISQLRGSGEDLWEEDGLDSMYELGGAIHKMVATTRNLKEELERQQPLLETALFQKIISGEFTDSQQLDVFATQAKVALRTLPKHIVVCRVFANNDFYTMDNQTLEEVNIAIILIKNTLRDLF